MERFRHPEIIPLELSEVKVEGATLWEWSQGFAFSSVLCRAVETLLAGRDISRLNVPVPEVVSGFGAVFVTGGRVCGDDLRGNLSRLPVPVFFGEEPLFGGERGGFELLETHGLTGWVADLGQSQLKLAAPGHRWIFPRDWSRLRASGRVSSTELPAQRRRLREFIAVRLQMGMAESAGPPCALVFALPTGLADDGTPVASSYAGMEGDRTLLPDALELAGLSALPLLVLNDAELAALGARSDARLAGFRKVLVLTLGFGIGAALIHRAAAFSGA